MISTRVSNGMEGLAVLVRRSPRIQLFGDQNDCSASLACLCRKERGPFSKFLWHSHWHQPQYELVHSVIPYCTGSSHTSADSRPPAYLSLTPQSVLHPGVATTRCQNLADYAWIRLFLKGFFFMASTSLGLIIMSGVCALKYTISSGTSRFVRSM